MLTNKYLCIIANNKSTPISFAYLVVNCLQISIFALSQTTEWRFFAPVRQLWIAYKLVSLHYRKQRNPARFFSHWVVNCLQISIFALSQTTCIVLGVEQMRLWIAYKLVSLHYRKQLTVTGELLIAVVNCLQISIFALSQTTIAKYLLPSCSCELLTN